MMPMFAIVVVNPAINGKAPQIPQPIAPRKKSCKDSFFNWSLFFLISLKKKGNKITNTVNHLQKASDIGGTNSTPPRATIVLVAINIGWTNKRRYG